MPEKKISDKELVEKLFDLLCDSNETSEKDLDASLREHGKDPEALEKKGLAFIGKLERDIKYGLAEKKKSKFESFINKILQLKTADEKRSAIIKEFMPKSEEQKLVFNRKLEKISDSYLETLEEDSDLLDLWSKFAENQDSDND